MSQHPSRDAAAEHLRTALAEIDPDGSVDRSEVEGHAITHHPREGVEDDWRVAEGTELEQIIGRLRDR